MGKPKQPARLTPAERDAHVLRWREFAWKRARVWHEIGGGELDDYFQAAMVGLCEAAGKFDPRKKFQFITYASKWVEFRCRRMAKQEAQKGGLVPGSRNRIVHFAPLLLSDFRAASGLAADPGSPTPPGHAADGEDGGGFVPDHREQPAEERNAAADLRAAVAALPPGYAAAVRLRFLEGKTLAQVAAALGVPERRAAAAVRGGVRRLREGHPGLEAYLDRG